jgi:catechol 2,3-dioxygenase-like lactoylglutathione lyase family enzyme
MISTSDVICRTGDLAAAKAYYHAGLGFPIVADSERVVGFDTGAFAIYFERGDPNGAVFEFEVDDVAQAKAEMLARGCSLVEEDPALPRCYLRDRFGLVFNLTQSFS